MAGGLIDYTMPAYSVTTLELSAPATTAQSLSVGDVTVTEGDAGTTTATFTVTLSPN
jgi:hypothetical protein